MATYRIKRFAIIDDTLDWAKRFTPRIPIGDKVRVWFLWPGTIAGALIGLMIGIGKKFKHVISSCCVASHDHPTEISHKMLKEFSDIPLDIDFNEYTKVIPGYRKLAILATYNENILDKVSSQGKDFIYKYFPSFLGLCKPERINEYRKDFINKSNQDYSEVLFSYGDELTWLWDFDRLNWYMRDYTYNPVREYKIYDNDNILMCIHDLYNPKKNQLLENRLKKYEELNHKFPMRLYVDTLLKAIEHVNKNY